MDASTILDSRIVKMGNIWPTRVTGAQHGTEMRDGNTETARIENTKYMKDQVP